MKAVAKDAVQVFVTDTVWVRKKAALECLANIRKRAGDN